VDVFGTQGITNAQEAGNGVNNLLYTLYKGDGLLCKYYIALFASRQCFTSSRLNNVGSDLCPTIFQLSDCSDRCC